MGVYKNPDDAARSVVLPDSLSQTGKTTACIKDIFDIRKVKHKAG